MQHRYYELPRAIALIVAGIEPRKKNILYDERNHKPISGTNYLRLQFNKRKTKKKSEKKGKRNENKKKRQRYGKK